MRLCESSQAKHLRVLIDSKMQDCLTKPEKYQTTLPLLESFVKKPNQKAIQMIVKKIKKVIKAEQQQPVQKLRAMILLRDLMESQSKALGKYVVKKILKRLTIFAQHNKNQKDQNRGANIFKCERSQQKNGQQFLKTLLLALEDWGKNWPRNADGPFHDFQAAYNDLLMEKQVTFPTEQRRTIRSISPKHSPNVIQIVPQSSRNTVENPISKPTMKQKLSLIGPAKQYVNGLIEISNLLIAVLTENPQFSDMWSIIKDYVESFRQIDEKGKSISAQLLDKQEQNQNHELFESIQQNSQFISQLLKDTARVDKKNQNYKKYHDKYIKQCKKLIVSLAIFNSRSSSVNNSNIKENIDENKPKLQSQKNRYESSKDLRNKLQFNTLQFKKEDFNSKGSDTSKWNSVSGYKDKDKNRDQDKEKDKDKNRQQTILLQKQIKEKSQNIIAQIQNSNKQKVENETKHKVGLSQNQQQQDYNKYDFEKDVPKQSKSNISGFFGDQRVQNENNQKQDDNEQFFQEMAMKNNSQINQQGKKKKRKKEIEDSEEKDSQNKQRMSEKQGSRIQQLDTFQNPKEIAQALQDIKKSTKYENRSSGSNPFEKTITNDNPFENSSEKSVNNRSFDPNINPFLSSNIVKDDNNPFELSKQVIDNPFTSNVRQQSQDENKSKSSNPFSDKNINSKISKISKISEQKPSITKKSQSAISNPFDTKSQISQNQMGGESNIQKQKNNMSNISNPFEIKDDQKRNSLKFEGNSNISAKSDKQKKLNKQGEKMTITDSLQLSARKSGQQKQGSFKGFTFDDFVNIEAKKSDSSSSTRKKQENNKNNRQSFNFSDFGNINNSDLFDNKNSKIEKKDKSDWFQSNQLNQQQIQNIVVKDNLVENFFNKQNEKLAFDDFNNNVNANENQNENNKKNDEFMKNSFSDMLQLKQKGSEIKKQQKLNTSEDEWNKFPDVEKLTGSVDFLKKTTHEIGSTTQQFPPSKTKKRKSIENISIQEQLFQKQPYFGYEKQLEILLEEPSSFRKKQFAWNFSQTILPSPPNQPRYNITTQDINIKKQQLSRIQQLNTQKIGEFNERMQKLKQHKKEYIMKLQKINEIKLLNKQYKMSYKNLDEINSMKQKQIQSSIKKNKKADEILKKILENQRILYEKIREDNTAREMITPRQKAKNKYERFNNNLKMQRMGIQMRQTVSNFSQY